MVHLRFRISITAWAGKENLKHLEALHFVPCGGACYLYLGADTNFEADDSIAA